MEVEVIHFMMPMHPVVSWRGADEPLFVGKGERRDSGNQDAAGRTTMWAELQSTDREQAAGFRWNSWSLVCDPQTLPFYPRPHQKTRASNGSRVFAALSLRIRPPVIQSNSRPATLLKFGPDVVATPGRTPALTVLPWGRSRHSFTVVWQSIRGPFSLSFPLRECRARAYVL